MEANILIRSFKMKFKWLMLFLVVVGLVVFPATAATWTVDDDKVQFPAADFTHPQDAVNTAAPGDTILVYPGTYGSRGSACGWASTEAGCGCGDWFAPALIVYKNGLTIQATGTQPKLSLNRPISAGQIQMLYTRSTNLAL